MYVISQRGSKNVYGVKNTFAELELNCQPSHLEAWQYCLETFGQLVLGDWQYNYIADFHYEPTRTVHIWYHLLKKNWYSASYNIADIPQDIFIHKMNYP